MSDDYPKSCKEWKGRLVRVNGTMTNNAGEVFQTGEILKVCKRTKDGKMELRRVPASIYGHVDHCLELMPSTASQHRRHTPKDHP